MRNFVEAAIRSLRSIWDFGLFCRHRRRRSICTICGARRRMDGPFLPLAARARCCTRSPHCRLSLQPQKLRHVELTHCGQICRCPSVRLLMQQQFAGAATSLLHCSEYRKTGPSHLSRTGGNQTVLFAVLGFDGREAGTVSVRYLSTKGPSVHFSELPVV